MIVKLIRGPLAGEFIDIPEHIDIVCMQGCDYYKTPFRGCSTNHNGLYTEFYYAPAA